MLETRAAIGTAETPAEPISGFTFVFEHKFINFAISTPPAVASENAMIPSKRTVSYTHLLTRAEKRIIEWAERLKTEKQTNNTPIESIIINEIYKEAVS